MLAEKKNSENNAVRRYRVNSNKRRLSHYSAVLGGGIKINVCHIMHLHTQVTSIQVRTAQRQHVYRPILLRKCRLQRLTNKVHAGPDLGGTRGPGPKASHQQGASHQTHQFFKYILR